MSIPLWLKYWSMIRSLAQYEQLGTSGVPPEALEIEILCELHK